MKLNVVWVSVCMLGIAGCAPISELSGPASEAETPGDAPLVLFDAEVSDDVAADDGADAAQSETSVAGLGDIAAPGLWVATALVSAPTPGRVTYLATGASVAVQLRPLAGEGGAQLSLAAFQALGAPITELIEVQITRQ